MFRARGRGGGSRRVGGCVPARGSGSSGPSGGGQPPPVSRRRERGGSAGRAGGSGTGQPPRLGAARRRRLRFIGSPRPPAPPCLLLAAAGGAKRCPAADARPPQPRARAPEPPPGAGAGPNRAARCPRGAGRERGPRPRGSGRCAGGVQAAALPAERRTRGRAGCAGPPSGRAGAGPGGRRRQQSRWCGRRRRGWGRPDVGAGRPVGRRRGDLLRGAASGGGGDESGQCELPEQPPAAVSAGSGRAGAGLPSSSSSFSYSSFSFPPSSTLPRCAAAALRPLRCLWARGCAGRGGSRSAPDERCAGSEPGGRDGAAAAACRAAPRRAVPCRAQLGVLAGSAHRAMRGDALPPLPLSSPRSRQRDRGSQRPGALRMPAPSRAHKLFRAS